MSSKGSKSVKKRDCTIFGPVLTSTWDDIVATYNRDHSQFPKAEIEYFSSLSLQKAIEKAALCRTHDDKRHPHQYRLKQETLNEFHEALQVRANQIMACTSFDALFHVIKESRVSGVGELTIYDTTHRIGIQKKLAPERVYIHAGTRGGASALGIDCKNREALEMTELPEALQQAGAAAAEDILCLFKDRFSGLKL